MLYQNHLCTACQIEPTKEYTHESDVVQPA